MISNTARGVPTCFLCQQRSNVPQNGQSQWDLMCIQCSSCEKPKVVHHDLDITTWRETRQGRVGGVRLSLKAQGTGSSTTHNRDYVVTLYLQHRRSGYASSPMSQLWQKKQDARQAKGPKLQAKDKRANRMISWKENGRVMAMNHDQAAVLWGGNCIHGTSTCTTDGIVSQCCTKST